MSPDLWRFAKTTLAWAALQCRAVNSDSFIRLAAVLTATGLVGVFVLIVLTAISILRPPRMTDGKAVYRLGRLSPGDLGLPFEDVHFQITPRLRLAGWWIPAEGSKDTSILIHGYADAKVGSIAWAPLLHSIGLNVLAIDLRRHGESGGAFSTGGCRERADVSIVIDQLRSDRPHQTRRVILYGISLGAAVAAAVAADRTDIDAVVLESPFADFRTAVARHAELAGLPGGWILSASIRLAESIAGVRFADASPLKTIPRIRCQVLAIVGAEDALMTGADRERLGTAVDARPGHLWVVPNAPHLLAMHTQPVEYASRIREFTHTGQVKPPAPPAARG
jgi:pimeloyl-ACP methyl ester carboxylesterase